NIIEGFEAGYRLVLAEGGQQVRELVLRNIELGNCLGQCQKYRMFWRAVVTGIEFALPLVEKFERCGSVSNFVTEIVRDPAIGVHVEKMLAQAAGKKQTGYRKVLVMRPSQPSAVGSSFIKRRRGSRNGVGGGQARPS